MLLEAPVVAPEIVFFSSISGNTARFVAKLGRPAVRIPLHASEPALEVTHPYVLVTPTYGEHGRGSVPKQVIRFLNDEGNRSLIRGVVAAGNTNFGADFCIAGDIIAAKCGIPYLYRVELFGTPEDVDAVNDRLDDLWRQ
ncbi:class Ib ribonucleoside-diphosphate reductase assembly flavoprotein NrdI [Agrococcus sp. SGAir0287]|uniref:class Ib ribonucleoside-diphosphate reductase assembly flavoprotein NrdI n=1 Tax=Agrococcus sp. SGAir0287 TaxID=2070347 RepID=UPI0010CD0B80|nr:class Ib ribonucleoside-diphosphate reductase assembly flavoprotein NrdI [Agrococcus sp. SGAir0287]QCR20420.1 class Ib ribonucleoside-diphosphate reductase assembly flavoprotein NrdI [Agrococcus sp. SGAir0287]